jgi:TPR repeat protein
MKRVLLILSVLIGLLFFGAVGAGMTMSDDDLTAILNSVPGAGSHSETVIEVKHSVTDGISHYIDDTLYSIKSSWRDLVSYSPSNRIPHVIIELEPVRTSKAKMPSPATEPKEKMATGPEPMKLMPKTPPASEPKMEKPPETAITKAEENLPKDMPDTTPESMPEEMKAPETTEEKENTEPQEMAKLAPPPPAPKPAPVPVQPEPEEETKAPDTVAPPKKPAPPPAPPAADDGTDDHKKGLALYKGIGVEKNFDSARKQFEIAAKKGHPAAQYNLGIMSYLGQGTEQDFLKASDWFRMAAEQEHALAQYNLGFLYFEGKGVEKDDLQAFMWIDRAATQGDEKAIKARDALAKSLPAEMFNKK